MFIDCNRYTKEITFNFGDTANVSCGMVDAARAVSWFKNGNRISESAKPVILPGKLSIGCFESSDTGEYICKDKITLSCIDSYKLTVNNSGMLLHVILIVYIK